MATTGTLAQEVILHANAKFMPAGRLVIIQRIASGDPLAHVAAEMGVSRTTAAR